MFTKIYEWIISLFTKQSGLPAEQEENPNLLKLNLQYFAESDEGDSSNEGDDEGDEGEEGDEGTEEEELDIDELLKDKKFKKQYQAKMKEQLNKRLKKFEDVDPDEYRRLKEKAEKKQNKQKEDEEDEAETLRQQIADRDKRIARAERQEKKALVKEYAVDNQVNPKLLARLINVDDIELNDDGEPENLDELYDELEEEFPEYFGQQQGDDEEEDEVSTRRKKSTYRPGSRQKNNKKTKDPDPVAEAKADIERRYGKTKEE